MGMDKSCDTGSGGCLASGKVTRKLRMMPSSMAPASPCSRENSSMRYLQTVSESLRFSGCTPTWKLRYRVRAPKPRALLRWLEALS